VRRVASAVFLVLGGWVLMCEPVIAFTDMKIGPQSVTLLMTLFFLVFAAVPLAIGVALSPGDRRRELGLTILIALALATLGALTLTAMLLDPGFKQFKPLIPPMPDIGVAPVIGVLNLIVVAAIGWLLYRRPARG
jgi:hypothetical protein